ncbi:hypothetical protein TCAL_06900 [Tigriopus californicus]|uniref:Microbial-type PARG catalytic domain-containing protein n=1 Tax=Tigriopus californicus TaxID=6832 RepID=A0A553PL81_TIGCA|nr:uncharacterized protein LOC131890709 [Tigriopus californicus]TRY78438.1 hypothetical protein TCAL_06900 [Tigriopus californicus]|eukprot:TCALIF_06900-PA protein Name:"Protein of unknown function" AED:0.41 eAED:0.42 QI:0/-1/0/1/-1/1/1/0/282
MANKSKRVKIGNETLTIINAGGYKVNTDDILIKEQIEQSISKSQVYKGEDILDLEITTRSPKSPQVLEVTQECAISACRRIRAEDGKSHIGCLNFASAKNVCGGMLKGSLAQEESLGYCTTLYPTLDRFQAEYYETNRRDPKQGLYNDILIVSPDVMVIRDDSTYELLSDPFPVTFLSSPAVNKGHALTFKDVPETLIQSTMERRIESVLKLAIYYEIDSLVLGAWGCGVFKNEPIEIARMFSKYLCDEGSPFLNRFSKVVFAIGSDKAKLVVFKKAMMVKS